MSSAPKTVDDYIANAAQEAQAPLRELRQVIRDAAPDAEERISYGMPSYRLGERLAYFSAHTKHIGLYPASVEDVSGCGLDANLASKSTLRFPLDQPLPAAAIRAFIERRAAQLRASGS